MMLRRHGTAVRLVLVFVLITMIPLTLVRSDVMRKRGDDGERLYFPSGVFLVESSLGFRSAFADYLWFRFIQYFGSYAKGHHDLRYFDVLLESVTRLDPRFIEAYNFGSLVAWSELGDFDKAVDILKQGVVHNPDTAELPFKIAFIYYVFYREYELAGMWFEAAARCSDATDREARFAAFARPPSRAAWRGFRPLPGGPRPGLARVVEGPQTHEPERRDAGPRRQDDPQAGDQALAHGAVRRGLHRADPRGDLTCPSPCREPPSASRPSRWPWPRGSAPAAAASRTS
jgi:tetratricopeptide (TPR) repeat protein